MKAREVSKEWLHLIDATSSLWRKVELVAMVDEQSEGGFLTILDVFDEKSRSTLKEVLINRLSTFQNTSRLIETLKRSSQTLLYLSIHINHPSESEHIEELAELSFKLPKLKDFRLTVGQTDLYSHFGVELLEDSHQRKGHDSSLSVSNLKVLWFPGSEELFDSHLHLLDNLSSLSVDWSLSSSDWRAILEDPSKSLKHLKMSYQDDLKGTAQPYPLKYPCLEVLETHPTLVFPQWLQILPSTTLLLHNNLIPSGLPSIYSLWLMGLSMEQNLLKKMSIIDRAKTLQPWTALLRPASGCVREAEKERRSCIKGGWDSDGSSFKGVCAFQCFHLSRPK